VNLIESASQVVETVLHEIQVQSLEAISSRNQRNDRSRDMLEWTPILRQPVNP